MLPSFAEEEPEACEVAPVHLPPRTHAGTHPQPDLSPGPGSGSPPRRREERVMKPNTLGGSGGGPGAESWCPDARLARGGSSRV